MQTASGKVKSQSFLKGTKVTNLSSVTLGPTNQYFSNY